MFVVVLVFGIYFYAGRSRSLPGVGDKLECITVKDNRTVSSVDLKLSDNEMDILSLKLKALKIEWNGGRVHPFPVENVQFFVDYVVDGEPVHLVLGEPSFVYEKECGLLSII